MHCGAGGVGHIAVQIAKTAGAHVFSTVSTLEKGQIAKGLGVDDIIYYRNEGLTDYIERCTGGLGFDVVLDSVGGETLNRSLHAVRHGGHVVSIMTLGTHDLTPAHRNGATLHEVFMLIPMLINRGRDQHTHILKKCKSLFEAGKLHPLLDDARFAATDVGQAQAHFESGKAIGKVVVRGF